jgi:hypothetical protein
VGHLPEVSVQNAFGISANTVRSALINNELADMGINILEDAAAVSQTTAEPTVT